MMTKEEAWKWARICARAGAGPERRDYIERRGTSIAKRLMEDGAFTYGVEYGILIATEKFFGEEPEPEGVEPERKMDGDDTYFKVNAHLMHKFLRGEIGIEEMVIQSSTKEEFEKTATKEDSADEQTAEPLRVGAER